MSLTEIIDEIKLFSSTGGPIGEDNAVLIQKGGQCSVNFIDAFRVSEFIDQYYIDENLVTSYTEHFSGSDVLTLEKFHKWAGIVVDLLKDIFLKTSYSDHSPIVRANSVLEAFSRLLQKYEDT
jgi:hypothetical protein